MSFHRSYSYTNFHQKLIFFLVFKNLFKKLYQRHYGLTHTVVLRILCKCSPNAHIFFGVKNLMKNCSGPSGHDFMIFHDFTNCGMIHDFGHYFSINGMIFLLYQMLILKFDTVNLFASLYGNFLFPKIISTTNRLNILIISLSVILFYHFNYFAFRLLF